MHLPSRMQRLALTHGAPLLPAVPLITRFRSINPRAPITLLSAPFSGFPIKRNTGSNGRFGLYGRVFRSGASSFTGASMGGEGRADGVDAWLYQVVPR